MSSVRFNDGLCMHYDELGNASEGSFLTQRTQGFSQRAQRFDCFFVCFSLCASFFWFDLAFFPFPIYFVRSSSYYGKYRQKLGSF